MGSLDTFWQQMATNCNFWQKRQLLATNDSFRQQWQVLAKMPTFGNKWQRLATNGKIWQQMANFGN
jgi:hypothetical protein